MTSRLVGLTARSRKAAHASGSTVMATTLAPMEKARIARS
jgi:hypothetical protein